eukprot:jgi/Mesvir1/28801/Mv25582-RA.4
MTYSFPLLLGHITIISSSLLGHVTVSHPSLPIQVNRVEGSFLPIERHGGYGLGYAGIPLGASFALDLWVKNAFENKPSLSPSGRHVLLTGVGKYPKWSLGVFEGNLSVHVSAPSVHPLAGHWRVSLLCYFLLQFLRLWPLFTILVRTWFATCVCERGSVCMRARRESTARARTTLPSTHGALSLPWHSIPARPQPLFLSLVHQPNTLSLLLSGRLKTLLVYCGGATPFASPLSQCCGPAHSAFLSPSYCFGARPCQVVADQITTHIASLADYWSDVATNWVRLSIVSLPRVQFLYINSTRAGQWAGNRTSTIHAPILMFGNSPEWQMAGTWGTWVRDVRFCATTDPRQATSLNEKLRILMRRKLEMLKGNDTSWAPQLVGKRVLLVGNSNTLLGSRKGKHIDSYDAVFRFNALPIPNPEDFGTLTTHEVLGDLAQLCGCSNGTCCTPAHIASIRARGVHTIIYAHKNQIVEPIMELADASTTVTHISVHRHVAKYVNALMDLEEERSPKAMAGSHRAWAEFGFRTGMRLLLALLAHGAKKPAIIGFDLGKEDNPLFNGRRKWSAAGDAFKYLPETLILQDMVKGGMIVDLMDAS